MFEAWLGARLKKTPPFEPAIENAVFSSGTPPSEVGFHYNPVVVGSRLYHFGFYTGTAGSNRARYYDTTTNTFKELAPLPTTVYGACALHANGKIYILGGTRGNGSNTVIIYDIASNTYTQSIRVLPAMTFFAAAIKDNLIYIANADNTGTLYIYNILTDTYTTTALNVPSLNCGSCTIVGDYIYVFGGRTAGTLIHQRTAYRIHLTTLLVQQLEPLPHPLMVVWNRFVHKKYIVFVGGFDASSVSSFTHGFFYYDTETDMYKVLTTPQNIRGYAWSGLIDNTFYMIGGITNNTGKSDTLKLTLAI